MDSILRDRRFITRRKSPEHQQKLPLCGGADPVSNKYGELIKMVFSHHISGLRSKAKFHQVGSDLPSQEKLIEKFHAKYYRRPKIVDRIAEVAIGFDSFYNTITKSYVHQDTTQANSIGPCNCIALIGKIGTGKTTLCSNLMVNYGHDLIKNHKLIPLRIDIEIKAAGTPDGLNFLLSLLNASADAVKKLPSANVKLKYGTRTIHDFCSEIVGSVSNIDESTDYGRSAYCNVIKRFCLAVHQTLGYRFLIIIDNADLYHYLFQRAEFNEKGAALQNESCQKLYDIVRYFLPGGKLSDIGASVLVSMRRITREYCEHMRRILDMPAFSDVFGLEGKKASEVMETRLGLFRFAIDTLVERRMKEYAMSGMMYRFAKILELRQQHEVRYENSAYARYIDTPMNMVDDVGALCGHGHRTFVKFMAELGNYSKDSEVEKRYFKQRAPLLITFILSSYKRYSQFTGNLPNLFLVRANYEPGMEELGLKELHDEHRHTYWAKYLISIAIRHIGRNGARVSPETIKRIFTGGGYEKHLVEVVMGGLCQSDRSDIINPVYDVMHNGTGVGIQDIILTDRGCLLLDRYCFQFIYLQLIIDDYLLQIPEPVIKYFMYTSNNYGYLVNNNPSEYSRLARAMINEKVFAVMLFLLILEISLVFERERYSRVFAELDAYGVILPDFALIRKNVASSAKYYAAKNLAGEQDGEGIANKIIIDAMNGAEKWRDVLASFFREAYIEKGL